MTRRYLLPCEHSAEQRLTAKIITRSVLSMVNKIGKFGEQLGGGACISEYSTTNPKNQFSIVELMWDIKSFV